MRTRGEEPVFNPHPIVPAYPGDQRERWRGRKGERGREGGKERGRGREGERAAASSTNIYNHTIIYTNIEAKPLNIRSKILISEQNPN